MTDKIIFQISEDSEGELKYITSSLRPLEIFGLIKFLNISSKELEHDLRNLEENE